MEGAEERNEAHEENEAKEAKVGIRISTIAL